MAVAIELLADHSEHVETLARWHCEEDGRADDDEWLEFWRRQLRSECGRERIPIAFVALDEGAPVGHVSLVEHNMSVVAGLADRVTVLQFGRILTEGGPRLMGSMLRAGVVDELFLTIAPKLIGGGSDRPPLSDDADLLDVGSVRRLLSVRRGGDFLFLRYALASSEG